MVVEELLQTLVGVVDAQLFERVVLNTTTTTEIQCVTVVKLSTLCNTQLRTEVFSILAIPRSINLF